MTTGMLQQDTIQTSPSGSGPRFRPYACANHHVTKGRYITSNDSRGYIPVYEYPLNGQWIMMDIDDGYILWTGIWKALGNSKADIVKMIDSQPDLAPLIRRVRGGYLKIQGTWMPYEVALKLSRRVAWMIRDDLIPLFGPTFPSTCLSPDQPGYGQVVPTGQNRRRARRTTRNSIMEIPRAPTGWTVVTPTVNMIDPSNNNIQGTPPSLHPANVRPSDYHMASPYPVHSHIRSSTPSDIHLSPIQNTVTVTNASSTLDPSRRFGGGYSSHPPPPPPSYRSPVPPSSPSPLPSKAGLSLDIGFLSMRDGSSESRLKDEFSLPPIQAPDSNSSSPSLYSLPPISSMEDPRGIAPQDSAAVLRRLRMDDDVYIKPSRFSEDRTTTTTTTTSSSSSSPSWRRRHSVSHSSSKSVETSPRFQPYISSRSYQDHHPINRGPSPASNNSYHRVPTNSNNNNSGRTTVQSGTSPYSNEGGGGGDSTSTSTSTSNPSPTTPNSSMSESDHHHPHPHHQLLHLKGNMTNQDTPLLTGYHHRHHHHQDRRINNHHQWSTTHPDNRQGGQMMKRPNEIISIRRNSYEASSSDGGDSNPNSNSNQPPHRPW